MTVAADISRKAPTVAIMGGSIGGLNAALWLRKAGWEADVYERSPSPLEGRGAGIVLHPATARYFLEHRVTDLDRISAPVDWLRYLNDAGEIVHQSPCGYRFTSWTTLYRRFLGCLGPDRYHLAAEIVAFDRAANGVSIRSGSGEERYADLLVAADGVGSTARAALMPDAPTAYAGYVGWRGTVGEEELNPATAAVLGDAVTYHLMPYSHILAYPIPNRDGDLVPGRRQLNWVWYRNVEAGAPLADLMTDASGERHELSLPPGTVAPRHLDDIAAAARALPAPLAELVGHGVALRAGHRGRSRPSHGVRASLSDG